ncbi:sensor histidine kinase [Streptomyces morookaense]|uniref:Sensor histidine kinase n=1 Tax=Streptomyces morookaense TaxID=1970 RepID=A0A7Y7B3X2_STRMO|nr:histidine kinase [Streptomyces morookaense]NVK78575.1 sensor histidine kinase [Streptomyces morookaense]GHF33482.1 two-component sensor histidine kinase [Streptomyces morookaense]
MSSGAMKAIERMNAPTWRTFTLWLLVLIGNVIHIAQGRTPLPWLAGAGLAAFVACYVTAVVTSLDERRRETRIPFVALAGLVMITYALTIGYGNDWMLCFPLLSMAIGVVMRVKGPWLGGALGATGLSIWAITTFQDHPQNTMAIAWGTALSGAISATLLNFHETVTQLKATREELAHAAVERERLRFSRDLHDLLGHTMSVIVVKAEAVRRLAPRNLDAALGQAADIEAVGRQALTEIREAVTGYREGSLTTELDSARSCLDASGITADIRQSGPPLPPQTAALLGWVVREGVTNVIRHSGAERCTIEVRGEPGRVHLEITDDGRGVVSAEGTSGTGGTGLKGLTERLATAGGSLATGPHSKRGFRLVAELPVDDEEEGRAA